MWLAGQNDLFWCLNCKPDIFGIYSWINYFALSWINWEVNSNHEITKKRGNYFPHWDLNCSQLAMKSECYSITFNLLFLYLWLNYIPIKSLNLVKFLLYCPICQLAWALFLISKTTKFLNTVTMQIPCRGETWYLNLIFCMILWMFKESWPKAFLNWTLSIIYF